MTDAIEKLHQPAKVLAFIMPVRHDRERVTSKPLQPARTLSITQALLARASADERAVYGDYDRAARLLDQMADLQEAINSAMFDITDITGFDPKLEPLLLAIAEKRWNAESDDEKRLTGDDALALLLKYCNRVPGYFHPHSVT